MKNIEKKIYNFTADKSFRRLDLLLVEYFEEVGSVFSRNSIQNLIEEGFVKVNNKKIKPSQSIKNGDSIQVILPPPQELKLEPENIPLRIVYEDDYIIVVNKKAGMVVHPAVGNLSSTLVNALFFHCKGQLSTIGGETRPGVVHRLDKDTSGLLVVAKSDMAHLDLARQFSNKTSSRIYEAVLWGKIEPEGKIETFFGRHPSDRKKYSSKVKSGKKAITKYKVINLNSEMTYVRINLETGRTHQIRVHFSDMGNHLVGDKTYGRKEKKVLITRQALHAKILTIIHPVYKIKISFISPLESDIRDLLKYNNLIC
jgi:23S rRNA pseudouridine1911/1915/1917 synthase